jgi:phosphoribosylanthranilate isomerase
MPTRIKVCGLTSPEDAILCEALGVEFLGVIFAESKRRVTPARAAEIRQAVPHACLVGVFADEDPATVSATAEAVGLNMIQLHGDETPDYCAALRALTPLPIVKAFRNGAIPDPEELAEYETVRYILLDLDKSNPERGGGIEELRSRAATAARAGHRVFLAGALDPENVREAIEEVRPFCVDVASGVEREPGAKDRDTLRRFVTEVRG